MINMAMSVDGKVSSIAREPTTFTSREDKQRLLEIRSRCDALVVGAKTAINYQSMGISNPKLRMERLCRGQTEHPIRVIISGRLTISTHLPVFHAPISPILIVCCESAPHSCRTKFSHLGRLIVCGHHEVNIRRLITLLATEYHARTILCEGGPTLNDAFFRSGMVNGLYLTLCPRIVGGETAPTLADGMGVSYLKDAAKARLVACRRGKTEWFLQYRFLPKKPLT